MDPLTLLVLAWAFGKKPGAASSSPAPAPATGPKTEAKKGVKHF
jgi:hypothetical protein